VRLLADRPLRRWNAVMKWVEDLLLAGVITLALLPVLGLIAVAIKLDSPGPVIFRQRRHGWNNQEFDVFKFRTMRWEPESAKSSELRQTQRDDDRITRLGRFLRRSSLDELPQLFNVLRGDMSLVGPRPHAVNMKTGDQLGHEIIEVYAHRHRVKPGITGWAQVNGFRGATDTADHLRKRVELDIYYVENWSLLFDIKILFMTLIHVIKGKNAY
jgi:exopolysaccharide biosynthesis polyprenyl glycosylphosphotransferase